LREERHALRDDHRADAAEQRADDERAHEAVDDERVRERVVNDVVVGEADDELARDVVERGNHVDTASRIGSANVGNKCAAMPLESASLGAPSSSTLRSM